MAFHVGLKWKAGHKATDYDRWVGATEPYRINHTTVRNMCPAWHAATALTALAGARLMLLLSVATP